VEQTQSTKQALQEELEALQPTQAKTVTQSLGISTEASERRASFPRAQQRLSGKLSLGNKAFDVIEGSSNVTDIVDKLACMQIVRMMLDPDGNDGIIYAVSAGWNSASKDSIADRMGKHKSNNECNPTYRLGMQSQERQVTYGKRECGTLRIPYVEPKPEKKLEDATRMSSKEFAEFAANFHRKSLNWELKEFIYSNLNLPGTAFFPKFVAIQKKSDDAEEVIYKGAYAAHLRALDPSLGEDEAQDFLDMLSSMRWLENREAERSADRIAKRAPVVEAKPEAAPEPESEPEPKSAVPWYMQESYLKEKQQKEQPTVLGAVSQRDTA
jgi:hypothetical protein